MQFEQQTITFCTPTSDRKPMLAIVALGTGLAYGPINSNNRSFDVIHVASGFRLGGCFSVELGARLFLENLLPLTDWNQDEKSFTDCSDEFVQSVMNARKKAEQELEGAIKAYLFPDTLKALEERMQRDRMTLREGLEDAVDTYVYQEEETLSQRYLTEVLRTYVGSPDQKDMLNLAALGLAGETGEVVDHIKKALFQEHSIDADHLKEELGDILWYLVLAAHAVDVTLDEVIVQNIQKLQERYPDGFDPHRSRNR